MTVFIVFWKHTFLHLWQTGTFSSWLLDLLPICLKESLLTFWTRCSRLRACLADFSVRDLEPVIPASSLAFSFFLSRYIREDQGVGLGIFTVVEFVHGARLFCGQRWTTDYSNPRIYNSEDFINFFSVKNHSFVLPLVICTGVLIMLLHRYGYSSVWNTLSLFSLFF